MFCDLVLFSKQIHVGSLNDLMSFLDYLLSVTGHDIELTCLGAITRITLQAALAPICQPRRRAAPSRYHRMKPACLAVTSFMFF
jgi:hypothetical protein